MYKRAGIDGERLCGGGSSRSGGRAGCVRFPGDIRRGYHML